MKKIILFIGAIALVLNTFAGFLLSSYGQFNMILNYVVIFVGCCVAMAVVVCGRTDAARISLSIFNLVICLIQYVAGIVVRPVLADNFGILLIALLMVVDICICFIINHFTKYA